MNANPLEARPEWKARLVAFLLPHLKADAGERDAAVNTLMVALDTARAEGVRDAARFCRTLAAGLQQHGEAADALASSIEMLAVRIDAETIEAARQWQNKP